MGNPYPKFCLRAFLGPQRTNAGRLCGILKTCTGEPVSYFSFVFEASWDTTHNMDI